MGTLSPPPAGPDPSAPPDPSAAAETRVLVLMPTAKDGERTAALLRGAGLDGVLCRDLPSLCAAFPDGVGAVLLTEEAILRDEAGSLRDALRSQPAWSAIPLVVLAREGGGDDVRGGRLLADVAADVTLVERPVRKRTLLSVVAAALRARRHQYAARDAIADRERQADALRASEERFRRTFESVKDYAIFSVDPQGRVTNWNAGAERAFGYAEAEIVGRPCEILFTPEDRAAGVPARELAAAREAGRTEDERWHLRKDGGRFYASGVVTPMRDPAGGVLGYTKVARDVTERRRADAELARVRAESERTRRLYETILANTPDLAYVFDLDHRFAYANDVLLKMWGRTLDEAIGKTCLELGYEPWHAAMHDREIDQVVATKRPIRGEVPFEGTFGRRIYDYIFVPVLGANGEVEAVAGTTRDVTDRKRHEEAIRASEERFRQLADAMPQIVFAARPDGHVDYFNRRWYEYTGFPDDGRTGDESWAGVHEPEALGRISEVWGEAVRTGRPYQIEYRLRRADGEFRWHLGRALPVRDGEGAIVRWYGTNTDIHDRKTAEEALQAAVAEAEAGRRLLDAILDAMPVGVVIAEPDGRLVRMNRANDELWGLGGRKPGSANVDEYAEWVGYWPDTGRRVAPREWALARALTAGERVPGELVEIERFDGSGRRFMMNHAAPVRNAAGAIVAGVIAQIDVTDRVRAERQLAEARERLEIALSAGGVATWVWSIADDRIQGDRNLARLFGVSEADAAGGPLAAYVRSIHPDDRDRVGNAIAAALAGDADAFRDEYRVLSADGRWRWVDARGRIERDAAGRAVRMPGVILDVTDRKHAEDALKEADRRKDEFLATLAHELRNPLAPISNALQVWPAVEDDPAEVAELRELMGRQVTQMIRLIDDLLDISRITRGKIELRTEPLDLATVVETAVEAVRPFVDACGHDLAVDLPAEPIPLPGDAARLVQVFANLLNNAAKYTGRDGRLSVSAGRDGDEAVVRVRDDGPGIPAGMLGRVFEMFTQVDQTLHRAHGGLGIGLTLVKSLVEQHGGTVAAFSDGPGRGSEFVVRLPAEPAGAARPAPRPATPSGALPRFRVLVVDDVTPSAKTLAAVLRSIGQDADFVTDGPAALAAAAERRHDVVFLDIAMPGMDGYEVARRLRGTDGGGPRTLVALTGYGQEEDRRRAFDAGFSHHLVKPTSADSLRQLLATVPGPRPAGGDRP